MAARSKLTDTEEKFLQAARQILLSCPRNNTLNPEKSRELQRLMTSIVKASTDITKIVGAVCTTGAACSWLGISRQALNKSVQTGRTLGLKTADSKWIYPTWQFTSTGINSTLLPPVWDILTWRITRQISQKNTHTPQTNHLNKNKPHPLPPASTYAAAAWFLQPQPLLNNLTPAQWILQLHELPPLIACAKNTKLPEPPTEIPRLSEIRTSDIT